MEMVVPILPWRCAHGDAPIVSVACAETTDLSEADTNLVHVAGEGVIRSLGPASWVTKRVIFGAGVTLVHGDMLSLLTESDRVIQALSFGTYSCDGEGHWVETSFATTGSGETSRRLDELERRLGELERRAKT